MSVNRVLYLLTGASVAAMVALALCQKQDFGKVGSTDMLAVIVFGVALVAGAGTLIYSRRGRQLRRRFDQKSIDEDVRIHTNARTKGEVRPPLGP